MSNRETDNGWTLATARGEGLSPCPSPQEVLRELALQRAALEHRVPGWRRWVSPRFTPTRNPDGTISLNRVVRDRPRRLTIAELENHMAGQARRMEEGNE
jgi:hypothetical protein